MLLDLQIMPLNKKKKKKQLEKSTLKDGQIGKLNADNRSEKLFDFGGVPDRDLKKNLGC